MYIVECNNAGCSTNPDSIAVFKHAAIAGWNRRAPVQAQGVALSEREQFEAAYRKRHSVPAHAAVDFPDVQRAWIWWQERAALAEIMRPDAGAKKASGMIAKATFGGGHHIIVPIGNANELPIGTKLYAHGLTDAKDAARLDFIEANPRMDLRYHKKRWSFIGFTSYEYDVHKTMREAIDAAIERMTGNAGEGGA